MLPVCLAAVQLGMMSLVFVHDRIMAPTLPWLALLGLLGCQGWVAEWGRFARNAWIGVFAVYVVVFGVYSTVFYQPWWRSGHVCRVAREILEMGMREGDIVMDYGPQLSIETHRENPLLTVEVPYGSIEDVGRIAREKGVRFATISDTWRGHWPIAKVFEAGVEPPEGWVLRKELSFEKDETRGVSAERIRIYEVLTVPKS